MEPLRLHAKQRIVVLLLGLFVAGFAWASEPLSIKGFRPGMPFDEFQSKLPAISCDTFKNTKTCFYSAQMQRENAGSRHLPAHIDELQMISGVYADSWSFAFRNDRLGHISVWFSHDDFNFLVDAIKEKFGKPAHVSQDLLQNRFGARVRSRLYGWNVQGAILTAQEHTSSLDSSVIWLKSKTFDTDRKADAREAAKKASKDF